MRINSADDFLMDDYIVATTDCKNNIIELDNKELELVKRALTLFVEKAPAGEGTEAGYILREINYYMENCKHE